MPNFNLSIFSLLGADEKVTEIVSAAYGQFITIVNIILPVLMSVLLVLGMFYGIQIGVKYARAEEEDKKKSAREQLINVIVGVVIAILFIAIIEIILNQDFIKQLFVEVSTYSGMKS